MYRYDSRSLPCQAATPWLAGTGSRTNPPPLTLRPFSQASEAATSWAGRRLRPPHSRPRSAYNPRPLKAHRYAIPALACILYFSEGFPFGIATDGVNTYFSFAKVDLATIGLISSVGIIWTLKFFWAPLLDTVGTYRSWIFGSLIVLSVSIAGLGMVPAAGTAFWGVLVVLVFASATHDIAVDALAIRVTPREQLGLVNSVRVGAYRAAMLVAGGSIGFLGDRIGWRATFLVAGCVPLVILGLIAFTAPPERGRAGGEGRENPLRALWGWLRRPDAMTLLAVILLYRMGDNALTPMIRPYWAARGFSATEVGYVTSTLGMICTVLGAVAGGAFVTRFGVYRGLVVLGVVQMLSNLAYAGVAMTDGGRSALYGAAVVETFCGGLGTAAFLSFLMFICDRENAATEYAMLSALFAVGRTIAFAVSGFVARDLGYARYYALTALLALPALALLPRIRGRLSPGATAAVPAP
jgi:PAT family beta-lactamase induction signal transducer AmpG